MLNKWPLEDITGEGLFYEQSSEDDFRGWDDLEPSEQEVWRQREFLHQAEKNKLPLNDFFLIETLAKGLTHIILGHGRLILWVSFEEIVAIRIDNQRYVCVNYWGTPTGRHLNIIDGGSKEAKAQRLELDKFQEILLRTQVALLFNTPRPDAESLG